MKIAVMGTGGVGGYFGALLAQSGQDVTFIARGAHLRAIRARGLHIESLDSPFVVAPADATGDPEEVGPVELVLLCVKTYDLDAAIAQMQPLVASHTVVLTLQNGVEAPARVAAAFGPVSVLPGVVYCEVALKEPGVIVQSSPARRVILGELNGDLTERAREVASAFAATGADTTLSDNVLGALWSKFCFICAMGGVTTLVRRSLGPILADEEARALLRTVMEEARAVGVAQGVRFDADPIEAGMAMTARFPPEAKSSMLRDLERGSRIEIDALNGAVVRIGRRSSIATPANQAIYAALRMAQPG